MLYITFYILFCITFYFSSLEKFVEMKKRRNSRKFTEIEWNFLFVFTVPHFVRRNKKKREDSLWFENIFVPFFFFYNIPFSSLFFHFIRNDSIRIQRKQSRKTQNQNPLWNNSKKCFVCEKRTTHKKRPKRTGKLWSWKLSFSIVFFQKTKFKKYLFFICT